MSPLLFFWLMLKASLLSTSGLGNVPILHDDLTPHGWATESEFAEAIAVGQISPGPNGLWVVCLGYLVQGIRGALLAIIAIIIPPLLVIFVDRLHRRIKDWPAVEGFVHGLGLAVVGVFVVVITGLLPEVSPASLLIALAALGLGSLRRVPVIAIVLLASAAGVWIFRR